MFLPSPTEYLKTHIIAFLSGMAAAIAAQLYAKRVCSKDAGCQG